MRAVSKAPAGPSALNINLLSFGYKNGIPLEADLVFDVRFLPNPYFVSRLKALSGRDRKVVRYLRSFPETKEFVKRVGDLLEYLVAEVYAGREKLSYDSSGLHGRTASFGFCG